MHLFHTYITRLTLFCLYFHTRLKYTNQEYRTAPCICPVSPQTEQDSRGCRRGSPPRPRDDSHSRDKMKWYKRRLGGDDEHTRCGGFAV